MAYFCIRNQQNKLILKTINFIIAFAAIVFFAFDAPVSPIIGWTAASTNIDTLLRDKTKKEYLEMRGLIMESKTSEKGEAKLLDSATINIYTAERKYLVTFNSTKKGKCEFRLPLNSKFIIEVTRSGMVTKYLEVNTTVPKEKRAAFIFPFTIDIFADVKGLDVSILKKPIAKVNYSYTNDHFNYDYTYTDRINNDLKKMYKDFYFMQTIDAENADTLKPKTTHQPQNKKGPHRQ